MPRKKKAEETFIEITPEIARRDYYWLCRKEVRKENKDAIGRINTSTADTTNK